MPPSVHRNCTAVSNIDRSMCWPPLRWLRANRAETMASAAIQPEALSISPLRTRSGIGTSGFTCRAT